MLPVIGTDPIRFNLSSARATAAGNSKRPPSAQSIGENSITEKSDCITLYPITVEFDRLLRRQAQLKQFCPGSSASSSSTKQSPLHNSSNNRYAGGSRSNRYSSGISSNRSTPTKSRASPSSSLYDSPADPATILANLDAQELLYATIIHYYASLCPKWMTTGSLEQNGTTGTSTTAATTTTTTAASGKENNSKKVEGSSGQKQLQPEVESLDQIYNMLCTPGTRTLLLLADKNEIISNFLQQNPGEIATQLVTDLFLDNDDQHSKSQNGHEADIEDVETSDLESENHKPPRTATGKSANQRDRHRDFCCTSSGINSSMSEDCLTTSLRGDDHNPEVKRLLPLRRLSTIPSDCTSISNKNSRSYRICKLMGTTMPGSMTGGNSKSAPIGIKMGVKSGRSFSGKNVSIQEEQTTTKKSTKKYLQEFDHFLETALKRQQEFYRIFCQNHLQQPRSSKILEDHSYHENLLEYLGVEQQIVGCVTFYKSYRLSGIKVIELAQISVLSQYQHSGIGSYLLRQVKESGQIGPYDAIRVKIPNSGSASLKHFFLSNDFTDDMILNASFDQLDSVCSDGDEDQADQLGPLHDADSEEHNRSNASPTMHHSVSFDGSPTPGRLFRGPTRGLMSKSKTAHSLAGSPNSSWLSLCYLPPFSVATSLTRNINRPVGSASSYAHRHPMPQTRSLITELDNHYVDELIEEANGVWRRDLLAAYRTQWSCVGRLRAEIMRLRSVVRECEHSVECLKRENLQLKTKLLQNETSAQLNAQKHLFLLKNFNFDSLDF